MLLQKYRMAIYTKILEVNLFAFAYTDCFMKISLQSSGSFAYPLLSVLKFFEICKNGNLYQINHFKVLKTLEKC